MTNEDFKEAAENFREAKEALHDIPAHVLEKSEFEYYHDAKQGLWELDGIYRQYLSEE